MKKMGLMLLVFMGISSFGCVETKLIPFEQNNLWGYKSSAGNVVIEPRYYRAESFSKYGIAAVYDPEQGWIYIDTTGEDKIKPMFYDNEYDPFMEGLARYEENDMIGFFDEKGDRVIPAKFEFAFPFQNGLSAVARGVKKEKQGEHTLIKAEKWGFIDKNGELAIPFKFDNVYLGFEQSDHAIVVLDGQEVKINRQGEVIKGQ